MKQIDLKISRRLEKLLRKTSEIATKEFGEEVGISLIVHPYQRPDQLVAELQYISNLPRTHMHEAMRGLVAKWDAGGRDIPPHLKQ